MCQNLLSNGLLLLNSGSDHIFYLLNPGLTFSKFLILFTTSLDSKTVIVFRFLVRYDEIVNSAASEPVAAKLHEPAEVIRITLRLHAQGVCPIELHKPPDPKTVGGIHGSRPESVSSNIACNFNPVTFHHLII